MRVYNLLSSNNCNDRVSFSGRMVSVKAASSGLLKSVPSDDCSGYYLIASDEGDALLYLSARVDAQRLTVYLFTRLSDSAFQQWDELLALFKCEELDVVCLAEHASQHHICREEGMKERAKRVRFIPCDEDELVETNAFPLEKLCLGQSIEVGKLIHTKGFAFAEVTLERLSSGELSAITAVSDTGRVVGVMLYVDGKKELQSEGVVIDAEHGTPLWTQWFMDLVNGFLRESKRRRKPCVAAFAPSAPISAFFTIKTEVVTRHFGL